MFVVFLSRVYIEKHGMEPSLFEFDQARAMRDHGCKVVILGLDARSIRRIRGWGLFKGEKEGIPIYTFSVPIGIYPRFVVSIVAKILSIGLNLLFNRIVKECGKPDVLHAHFTEMGAMGAIIKQKAKIPLVFTEHSSYLRKEHLYTDAKYYGDIVYSLADRIITVSSSLKEIVAHLFGKTSVVIPNIVDTKSFTNKAEKISKGNDFVFVSTSNLIKGKGVDILIEAFVKADFEKNVKLLIIGDGVERKNLEAKAKNNSNIIFLGKKTRTEVAEIYRTSDAFVMASNKETFGVVYIEAMYSGLPVIATHCGGPEDFVNKENGILVPVQDKGVLKEALIYMRKNRDVYNSNKISEFALRNFAPEKVAGKIYDEYIKACRK